MDTAEVRRRFLAHFESNGHQVVPSASLLLDDPNLLFVNAGMVPFKPYFLGQETPPYDRAVSIQKCVRTPDIEDVGKTTRHGTFFEMCGNFSFGDYFKEGAIELAWELVTRPQSDGGYGLDESRLYPSVYEDDPEAVELWRKVTGLPDERIVRLGKSENYWSMGVPGPGGPCSEILYDRGPAYGADGDFGAEDRYLEFWNLVFMQDELSAVRSKVDFDIAGALPQRNIDTGMGLERVAFLLQGKDNMYDIDVMSPVIERAEELTGRRYGANHDDDVRFRVVSDHVRSSMMLISDGVTPGNEARGYVLRRLLRRAVRSMRLLGYEDRALPELMPVSRDKMGETYTELLSGWDRIAQVAYAEEDAFRRTLQAGTQIFDLAARDVKASGESRLSGRQGVRAARHLRLPDRPDPRDGRRGRPQRRRGGLPALMREQRERAKADARAKKGQHADTGVYRGILDAHGPTDWRAYETLETESSALALLRVGRAGAQPRGGRDRRARARPDAVLRRVRRAGRRRGHHRVRRRPARGARRAASRARPRRAPGAGGRRRVHPGRVAARPGRPAVAPRRAPGALGHPRGPRGPARGARAHGPAVRLLQPARLPAPRLRLDLRAVRPAGARRRAGLQRARCARTCTSPRST